MSLSTVSCNSPEYDVPWPFGQCAGATRPQAKSLTSALTCGLCNQGKFASYLYRMVERLEELKRAECSELVVYGAAFGDKFVNLPKTPDGKNRSASSYRGCSFMFVLDDTALDPLTHYEDTNAQADSKPVATLSGDVFIGPVSKSMLPYKGVR